MSTSRRKLGDLGEKIAREYLEKQNYKIIDLNWQRQWGEIDIIAQENNTLVFVEVKTRNQEKSKRYGLAQEAVNFLKQKKLIQTAKSYLFRKNYPEETNWRIDVVVVETDEAVRKARLRHIKNAVDYNN